MSDLRCNKKEKPSICPLVDIFTLYLQNSHQVWVSEWWLGQIFSMIDGKRKLNMLIHKGPSKFYFLYRYKKCSKPLFYCVQMLYQSLVSYAAHFSCILRFTNRVTYVENECCNIQALFSLKHLCKNSCVYLNMLSYFNLPSGSHFLIVC